MKTLPPLRNWLFGAGALLAASGVLGSIVLFMAMLTSLQSIQDRLPDSAALSAVQFGHEVDMLVQHWSRAKLHLTKDGFSSERDSEFDRQEFAAFLEATDIVIARAEAISDGKLYGYLDVQPGLRAPAAMLVDHIKLLSDEISNGHMLQESGREQVNALIWEIDRDSDFFVALIKKTRDEIVTDGLKQIALFKWLLSGAISLSVISALTLALVAWRQNRRLVDESHALQQARREADQARHSTELALRSRTRLFANTSHELRTPLNAIMGFSEIMATEALGRLGNDRYRGYCQDIHGSAQILLELVDELLLLGAVEEGSYVLALDTVDLTPILKRTQSIMALKAKELAISLAFDIPAQAEVVGEARAIRQIVINLLDNALKYTPEGGRVSLTVESRGTTLALIVDDSGPGIPNEQLNEMFQPFHRGDDAFVRQTKGAGLGLAIVKALATRLHTDVRLSRSLMGGLRAEFELKRSMRAPSTSTTEIDGLVAE